MKYVYEANDGNIFSSKEECEIYEQKLEFIQWFDEYGFCDSGEDLINLIQKNRELFQRIMDITL